MKNCNLYGCLIKNILFSNNVAKVDTLTTLSVSLSNPNRNFTILIFKILKICTILTVKHNDVMSLIEIEIAMCLIPHKD